jgi:hypothetical protein
MKRFMVIIGAFVFLAGCAAAMLPLTSQDYVLIDRTQPAYTVFVGIAKDKYNKVKAITANEKEAVLVTWDTFSQDSGKYVKSRIIKDDYPESRAVAGIVELVRKFPGTPIGLTWNGGIAITRNDYRHSEKTYSLYKLDPAGYDRTRIRDPQGDPVNPKGHLGPLLGW